MKFEARKPNRFHSGFYGAEVKHMWYQSGKWISNDKVDWSKETCSLAHCRTLRSFRRMLRNNPEIKGKARLIHRYIGFDVFA